MSLFLVTTLPCSLFVISLYRLAQLLKPGVPRRPFSIAFTASIAVLMTIWTSAALSQVLWGSVDGEYLLTFETRGPVFGLAVLLLLYFPMVTRALAGHAARGLLRAKLALIPRTNK